MTPFPRTVTAAGLLLLGGCVQGGSADGRWVVDSVGRSAVPPARWWVDVQHSSIVGGKDGCNEWRYEDATSPLVISAAQECPADPRHDAYWRIVTYNRNGKISGDGRLILKAGADEMAIHKSAAPRR